MGKKVVWYGMVWYRATQLYPVRYKTKVLCIKPDVFMHSQPNHNPTVLYVL